MQIIWYSEHVKELTNYSFQEVISLNTILVYGQVCLRLNKLGYITHG